jgi:hypothetical protein
MSHFGEISFKAEEVHCFSLPLYKDERTTRPAVFASHVETLYRAKGYLGLHLRYLSKLKFSYIRPV